MDPNKMVDLFGFEMSEWHRSLIIDLLVAGVMIFFIVLPVFCFNVDDDDFNPRKYARQYKKEAEAR